MMEENLRQKERELEEREQNLLAREIVVLLQQGNPPGPRPTPKKRKGKFRQKMLNKKEAGNIISMPSGTEFTLLTPLHFILSYPS